MAMGQMYLLVWRLLFVVLLREQRAALRGTQLEAKCKTKIKMSKVLYKIGVRFPYRLFEIKRKPKSTPKLAKYFLEMASDLLIGPEKSGAPN